MPFFEDINPSNSADNTDNSGHSMPSRDKGMPKFIYIPLSLNLHDIDPKLKENQPSLYYELALKKIEKHMPLTSDNVFSSLEEPGRMMTAFLKQTGLELKEFMRAYGVSDAHVRKMMPPMPVHALPRLENFVLKIRFDPNNFSLRENEEFKSAALYLANLKSVYKCKVCKYKLEKKSAAEKAQMGEKIFSAPTTTDDSYLSLLVSDIQRLATDYLTRDSKLELVAVYDSGNQLRGDAEKNLLLNPKLVYHSYYNDAVNYIKKLDVEEELKNG